MSTPSEPSNQEALEQNSPFQSSSGNDPLSTNPQAPQPQEGGEGSNSPAPKNLGGLIDPTQAALEDGT